jgi:hypothetical protein
LWRGALLPWKTALLFGWNVWIMGCTWLPNLFTYSLAVIRPWRVIMGPTEYCTTILLPKPSQNLPAFHCWDQARFQLFNVQVLLSWHHRLSIWALLSEAILLIIRQSLSVNVDFLSLFLFADDVFS